jgi:AraC family transcriptional regulator of adaptative response/methylated-DNA-[protein]-cysteine methyltransferase
MGRFSNPPTDTVMTTENDPRWRLLVDRSAGGRTDFVYAVMSTGVYCSPGSPTRLPRPENVVFFDTPAHAEAAGYRRSGREDAHQRNVEARHALVVAKACKLIEHADSVPSLNELATSVGVSAWHFHRLFKKITGLTPKAYGAACLRSRVRESLDGSETITKALYEAGYHSNSRFYETSYRMLGMKPAEYRAGGNRVDINFALGETSLGAILVAQSARGICAISLGNDPKELIENFQDQFPNAHLIGANPDFEALIAQVVGFVESPGTCFDLPLDIQGTVFQEKVWQALLSVPAGSTVTYTELAERIGMPRAVRAVANACGANKLAVAIPCHRVVRSDGSLSGYRWGVERKRALLKGESVKCLKDDQEPAH